MAVTIPDHCRVVGNPDLYGLGVRVGLYAQWMATLLATLFEPRSEDTYRLANLIIQAAIFLGLCTQSGPGDSVIGALVTQYLLCGSLSSLTGDGISHFAYITGIFRVLFYTAVAAYGCWFWFEGVDAMSMPGCPEIAFFGEVGIRGWFRTLGQVLSVLGLVLCLLLVAYSVYATYVRFRDGADRAFARRRERARPQVEIALLILSMGLIAVSIYLVEHVVAVNEIDEVGVDEIRSVGQLIPLLAGGLAGALTLWRTVAHRLFLRKRCWFLFGYHL